MAVESLTQFMAAAGLLISSVLAAIRIKEWLDTGAAVFSARVAEREFDIVRLRIAVPQKRELRLVHVSLVQPSEYGLAFQEERGPGYPDNVRYRNDFRNNVVEFDNLFFDPGTVWHLNFMVTKGDHSMGEAKLLIDYELVDHRIIPMQRKVPVRYS